MAHVQRKLTEAKCRRAHLALVEAEKQAANVQPIRDGDQAHRSGIGLA